MGTYTALHLRSTDMEEIQKSCSAWLASAHRTRTISADTGRFPSSTFAKVFDDKPPTVLVLGQTGPHWVTVHYNSFFKMEEPVQRLSEKLKCLGVVVLAQTVSDYYFISVYQNGENTRALEFAQGRGWLAQRGAALPFEQGPLGEDISEPGQGPYYFFDAQHAEAYCNNLGISIFDRDYESEWVILKARRRLFWLFG